MGVHPREVLKQIMKMNGQGEMEEGYGDEEDEEQYEEEVQQ
jgi:hypothetical protein